MTKQFQSSKLALLTGCTIFLSGCFYGLPIKQPEPIELPQASASPNNINNTNQAPAATSAANKEVMEETITATTATITTSKGPIVIEFFNQEAPNTIQNFLSKSQENFYDGLTFHRVEDWVIQGGDPLGNGTGGGKMPSEINDLPFKEGSVGVARGGDIKVNNDSQFFICTKDCDWLTGQYTLFAQVTEGMDVVKQIQIGDTINSISFE